jgi:hypothetical protein
MSLKLTIRLLRQHVNESDIYQQCNCLCFNGSFHRSEIYIEYFKLFQISLYHSLDIEDNYELFCFLELFTQAITLTINVIRRHSVVGNQFSTYT